MRERLRNFIESSRFEWTITAVIVANAIVLGLETVPSIMRDYGGLLLWLDQIAIAIFVIELLLKLFVYRFKFFANGWNVFDLIIVGAALVPASQQFSVLRALRILRALRLISVVPSMRKVIVGLFKAIPSIGTVIVMLLLLFYISAVMATKLFGEAFPDWFGNLGLSLYSLFQIMTLESWSMGIVRPVMEVYPYAWAFFVPFILLTSFIVLNLFIGVIVNAMAEATGEEAHSEREEILLQLKALREDVAKLGKQG
ncbi:ion transporter [Pontixanthobacter aestiaquae]|uniref:Ion transporter n=1 Tax=Pontixanthobacter aestiaquae TaxID=1509367 RepID=A0A844Z6D4_9SPHN|nr:ion transporter [Pontixanthobacter aestiaquae]MDN3645943.1 ion transporter [Pontixanthobacter aestiaquae]MXO83064.1 ion transporter [Pontixanthobacter aestiaquae]